MLSPMTTQRKWGIVLNGLVADPQAKHFHRMNSSVWLFLYLLTTVNQKTGRLTRSIEDIAMDMGLKTNTIDTWLGILKSKDYIESVKNNGQTIIQILKWRKVAPLYDKKPEIQSARKPVKKTRKEKVLVSEFESAAKEAAQQLGDVENYRAYINLFEKYSKDIIEKALTRVKSLPDEKIKKSRGALFTYLVKQYGQQN